MHDLKEALVIAASMAPAGETENMPLFAAIGRRLAKKVMAARSVPEHRTSSMDGYGVAKTSGLEGGEFRVIGESAAGHPWQGKTLKAKEALRVSTGAVLPKAIKRVIAQEEAEKLAGCEIRISKNIAGATYIREAGIDVKRDDTVLEAGTLLTPAMGSLLAAAGDLEPSPVGSLVEVMTPPLVGMFANGDELTEPGLKEVSPGKQINSIITGLGACIHEWGGQPHYEGIARDNLKSVEEVLDKLLEVEVKYIVPVGGASVGDHDLMRQAFKKRGIKMRFERVSIVPGRPTWFGMLGKIPVLGLPGNPASALVSAGIFLRAMLQVSTDPARNRRGAAELPLVSARLASDLAATGNRESFQRGSAQISSDGTLEVTPDSRTDSSLLSPLAHGNVLIHREAKAPPAKAGDVVKVMMLPGSLLNA